MSTSAPTAEEKQMINEWLEQVNLGELVQAVQSIAVEKPDEVYQHRTVSVGLGGPTCFYAHGDEPGCIIGQGLHKVGVPLEVLRVMDKAAEDDAFGTSIGDHLTRAGHDRYESDVNWLRQVQRYQDNGWAFGLVVQAVNKEVE